MLEGPVVVTGEDKLLDKKIRLNNKNCWCAHWRKNTTGSVWLYECRSRWCLLNENYSRTNKAYTSELVVSLVAGDHFTDGLLGADFHSRVQKHRPLGSMSAKFKRWTFGVGRRLQKLCQTRWDNSLCFHSRVQPNTALWTGNKTI